MWFIDRLDNQANIFRVSITVLVIMFLLWGNLMLSVIILNAAF